MILTVASPPSLEEMLLEYQIKTIRLQRACNIDSDTDVFPVASESGTRYDHPEKFVITLTDARRIGIEIE